MTDPVNLSAAVLAVGLIMYALFGGADFGGGIWTALAFGPRRREQREALFNAIGPVWETNHVWLIFIVVTLFTAFPNGFADLFIVLMAPLVLALVGINFRGAAFAFRHFGRETGRELPLSVQVFEIASVVTPFALGMAVSATAAGRVAVVDGLPVTGFGAWANPFTLVGGVIGLAICAYLAPIYMAARLKGELQEDFRKASIWAGLALGFFTTLAIPVAVYQAPEFARRLLNSWSTGCVALAVVSGILTQLFLWRRQYKAAQVSGASTIIFTLAGFAAALYPDLLIGELPLRAAAAPRPTLVAFLTVLPIGSVILVPSLVYLYWTFRGEPAPEMPPAGSEE